MKPQRAQKIFRKERKKNKNHHIATFAPSLRTLRLNYYLNLYATIISHYRITALTKFIIFATKNVMPQKDENKQKKQIPLHDNFFKATFEKPVR